MNLNELQYGNPTQTDFHALRLNNYLDPVFEQLKGSPMPKNDSMLTREELNVLRHYVDVIGSDKVLLNRYRKYDIRGMDYLRQVMVQAGADEDDINRLVWGIVNDTMPLIAKLKMRYQRPRPYQLARYYKLNLFPVNSARANNPSFPSGLTIQSTLVTKVLANRYPQLTESLGVYQKDYALSRLYLGLHYPTDNDFAIQVADAVSEVDEFKEKYGYYEEARTINNTGGEAKDDTIRQVEETTGGSSLPSVQPESASALQSGTIPDHG